MRALCLLSILMLGACASQPKLPTAWARADGQPVVSGLVDIASLDCKDEMQHPDESGGGNGNKSDNRTVVNHFVSCMREHGYVQAKS